MGEIHLLRGDDVAALSDALSSLVHRLVGDDDRSLALDEFDGDDYSVAALVDAAQTPPFLTERRVVVARGLSRFKADELAPLVRYLGDPLPTTSLVMVWTSGAVPKALLDALKTAGGQQTDTAPPGRRNELQRWLDDRLHQSSIRMEPTAKAVVLDQMGEEIGQLGALLDTLERVYGDGAKLTVADITPFLGPAGGVKPWDLTDAIDAGDTALALTRLHRMLGADRHPLQLLAVLHTHYTRMLRLDGSGATDERSAAALLGIKGSTFPARKAMDQVRRLGSDGIRRAMAALAAADLDVRGRVEWPDELVMEVLVARLSRLGGARARAAAGRARRG